jgi:hypothetical protein
LKTGIGKQGAKGFNLITPKRDKRRFLNWGLIHPNSKLHPMKSNIRRVPMIDERIEFMRNVKRLFGFLIPF